MEYIFTLKYLLASDEADARQMVERLGEVGCTDALLGIGQPGRLALEFSREAPSARAAMLSALAEVKQALPTACLFEAAPDYVGLSDVAEIVGVSRQNLRKLMLGYPATFPAPMHEGSTSLWHLAEVLTWLVEHAGYEIDEGIRETARAALEVNLATATRRLAPSRSKDLERLVG